MSRHITVSEHLLTLKTVRHFYYNKKRDIKKNSAIYMLLLYHTGLSWCVIARHGETPLHSWLILGISAE
jgi:hypothetical protein